MEISRFRTFRRDALGLDRVERPLKFSYGLGLLLLSSLFPDRLATWFVHVAAALPQEDIQDVLICRFIKAPVYVGVVRSVKSCRADPAGFRIEWIRERSTVGIGTIGWRFKQQSDTCKVHGSADCYWKGAGPTDLHESCGALLIDLRRCLNFKNLLLVDRLRE